MAQPPASQFSGIFVSYRREDSSGHAGRLCDRLVNHFGEDQIFMDVDTIEPGEDFVHVIESAVGSCEILIAVIGQRWLSSSDGVSRRLDNPNDFVRLEINAALNRGIRVIPVLVEGAQMPRPQDLPDELTKLARRHALELSDLRWRHDVAQLITVIEKVLAERENARSIAQEEESRQRRETEIRNREEKRRREAEGEARKARAEAARRKAEVQRQSTIPAPPPPPIRFEQNRGPADKPKAISRTFPSIKRVLLPSAVMLALFLLGSLVFLVLNAKDKQNENMQTNPNAANSGQPPVITQSNPSLNQPAAPTIISAPTPSPSPSGTIGGSVTDSTGAPIAGTTVTATRVTDSKSFRRSTGHNGKYIFTNLSDGVYSVRFESPNFNPVVITNIPVDGSAKRVNATLEVGSGTTMTMRYRGK